MTQRVEGDVDATAAQAIIQMLKDNLGMTVEHEVGERRETYARMYQNKIQLMWIRWYMDYPDPNNNNWQLFYSKIPESARRSHWVSADYDRVVDQAKGEKDQEKRKALYAQSDEILAKEAGAIFVHWPYRFGMIKSWLKGMPVNTQGDPVPNFDMFLRMKELQRGESRPRPSLTARCRATLPASCSHPTAGHPERTKERSNRTPVS